MKVKVAQSCPPLCDPMDCSLPESSVHGILQAKENWSGLHFPSPGDLPYPGIKPGSPALQADSFLCELQGSPRARKVMPKAYHRFHLTDVGEFLPSQGLKSSLRFLYLLVI